MSAYVLARSDSKKGLTANRVRLQRGLIGLLVQIDRLAQRLQLIAVERTIGLQARQHFFRAGQILQCEIELAFIFQRPGMFRVDRQRRVIRLFRPAVVTKLARCETGQVPRIRILWIGRNLGFQLGQRFGIFLFADQLCCHPHGL